MAVEIDAKEAYFRMTQFLSSVDTAREVLVDRGENGDVAAVLLKAHEEAEAVGEFLQCLAYPVKAPSN